MNILPLVGIKITTPTNISCKASPKIKLAEGVDTFRQKPFEALTLKTFEKLRETKYIPEKFDGYYSTYVIDKSTDKPVTALIKRTYLDKDKQHERYDFYVYDKKNEEPKRIGYCLVYVYDIDHDIEPAYVISPQNDKYAGMGVRAHQIAIERMLETGSQMK